MKNIQKIQKAIKFAIKTNEIYQKQTRKGKNTSYITHPLTVGIIFSQISDDIDLICAGILHDTIEDSIPEKKVTDIMLQKKFGQKIAQLVSSVSETNKKLSWKERKKEAIEHIKIFSYESLLLKSADVISNVTEIIDDYNKEGEKIFQKFNAPNPQKENMIKNYINVIETILNCNSKNPLKKEMLFLVGKLKNI